MKRHRFFIPFFLLIMLILIIYYAEPSLCRSTNRYYAGIIGSVLAAFFASFLVWVAWSQLGRLSNTSSADFIHRLNTDFFTPETRTLMSLIECNALYFHRSSDIDNTNDGMSLSLPYFKVTKSNLIDTLLPQELIDALTKHKYYSTWDIDDLLLGHFEDIGRLEQRGIVDFQMVYDVFSWYIETVWQCKPVKEYIRYNREGQENDSIDTLFYCRFQYIATKCLEYETLCCGPCKVWWKIKRYFCKPKVEWNI